MDKRLLLLQKFSNKLQNYENAFEELNDFCRTELTRPIEVAGLIQGFEFTFELAWKLLSVICALKGVEINGPRDTLKASYTLKILNDEATWLSMLEDRNMTNHRYDEAFVLRLTEQIKSTYRPKFQDLLKKAREIQQSES